MFVFNFKINGKKLFKIFFCFAVVLSVLLFAIASYKIFSGIKKDSEVFKIEDDIPPSAENEYIEIDSQNYSNILKEVHDNVDKYIGQKLSFTGYVYRVPRIK